jgi:hypothetical protein
MKKELLQVGNHYSIQTLSWNHYGVFLGLDDDGEGIFKNEYDEKFYINLDNPDNKIESTIK